MKSNHGKQTALIVLDGWGYREETKDNAIAAAKKPNFDRLWNMYPHTTLEASGLAVGLPEGQMGNSEVGHTTIGAGAIMDTDLVRISKSANTGEFEKNPAFSTLFEHVKKNNSTLHFCGLIGPGGVHAHSEHLFALLRSAKNSGLSRVTVHAFMDGRDTPPQSGSGYLKELEEKIAEIGVGHIATVSGRYYAMDRDSNWDRLAQAEAAIFFAKGNEFSGSASAYMELQYQNAVVDEHVIPAVCTDIGAGSSIIEKNDGVCFFNFRADRARMFTRHLSEKIVTENLFIATMTVYDEAVPVSAVAFPPISITETLAKSISEAGLSQVHVAETEKFAHATYFLNGGHEQPYPGEEHVLIPSHKDVATHDLAPEMRAAEIADKVVEYIEKGTDFIFINFANPDMVGHTANVPAIITAIEAVDTVLGKVITVLERKGGVAFITADHGNAEVNIDPETGKRHTAHTTNPVPAILTEVGTVLRDGCGLSHIAATVLQVMGVDVPREMTGKSLIG
ncbi:MAG: 2,3-bisphosphoglycerate-independent phosphoglycerate mutase [Candidatus Paceibacterota bacterium]|jgi:2,3-bisphosphoglycerate-independent phosphoglycerate mutase